MPDHDGARDGQRDGQRGALFGGVFARGGADLSDAAWLQAMLDTEAALARALERAGLAPPGVGAAVTAAARAADFDAAELGRLATLTGNPVPGLARALTRRIDGPAARTVHRGAASQDIIDTAAMLLARRAIDAARADLERAAAAAADLAGGHRGTLMIGRALLQQAVPVTFGVVAAGWLAGLDAAIDGLARARQTRLAVQFGGAAGTLASLEGAGIRVKALLAEELGLPDPPLPWHTERLRVIDVATAMTRVTAALSKIARDVTLLAQPEVAEVFEGVPGTGESRQAGGEPRRGGSPAMPNISNPVAAVAILGCARQVPGLLATLVASAEQEHQRAAGAWHAEWQPFSDILRLAGSAAAWGNELLSHLHVDTGKMAANLAAAGGLPMAERVTALLRNVLGGPQAYDLVTGAAARAASSGLPLRDVLLAAPQLEERLKAAGITADQIEAALDPAGYLGAGDDFITAALHAHGRTEHGLWSGKRTDRSDMAEIVSLAEAVRHAVRDGDTVAMEGFTHLIPFAAGHEVIRQRRRDLTLIRMTPDLIYDQLIGAGCARKLIFSWGGNPGVGSLHRFRDAVEHGWPRPLEIEEHSHAGMANRYVAGAAGLPFAVLRGYSGTGLVGETATIKQITCPFTGEGLTAVSAVNPDVAIIHAQRADRAGNVQFWGITGVQKEAVLAARRSIVTVEEIVGTLGSPPRPNAVVLPSWTVSYVARVPNGAHPSYALDYTVRDNDYYVAWDAIARDRETFGSWLEDSVLTGNATAGSPA